MKITGVVIFGMMVLNVMHFNNIERKRIEAYIEPTDLKAKNVSLSGCLLHSGNLII